MRKINVLCVLGIMTTSIIGCNSYIPEGYYISNNSLGDSQQIIEDSESESAQEEYEIIDINSETAIKINDVVYDFSKDCKDVVHYLHENEMTVEYVWNNPIENRYFIYDDKTNMIKVEEAVEGERIKSSIKRPIYEMIDSEERKTAVYEDYYLISSYLVDFETSHGISNESGLEELERLSGFTVEREEEGWQCSAICINGELIETKIYEEQYYQWAKVADEYGFEYANEEYFQREEYNYPFILSSIHMSSFADSVAELEIFLENWKTSLKENVLLMLAAQDAGRRLENGEIEEYVVITYQYYETERPSLIVNYHKYYLDEAHSDMEAMDSASIITINGEKYDISQKFDQVARTMRDNGINLYWQKGTTIGTYDENIQILGEDIYVDANTNNVDIDVDSDNTINAIKYFSETNLESNYNLSVYCSCYNFDSDKLDFETYQGITQYSDINDLRNLNNKAVNIDTPESFVCDVLCVNGELVSLDDYNVQYEQWVEDLSSYSLTDAIKKHFPNYNYQLLAWILDVDWFEITDALEFQRATEMMGGDYKQQILFAFALQDIGAKLENGEIDNFIIIRYVGTVGESTNIQAIYYKYVLIDKTKINWDIGLQL